MAYKTVIWHIRQSYGIYDSHMAHKTLALARVHARHGHGILSKPNLRPRRPKRTGQIQGGRQTFICSTKNIKRAQLSARVFLKIVNTQIHCFVILEVLRKGRERVVHRFIMARMSCSQRVPFQSARRRYLVSIIARMSLSQRVPF
jgi:hypothetical protein